MRLVVIALDNAEEYRLKKSFRNEFKNTKNPRIWKTERARVVMSLGKLVGLQQEGWRSHAN